MNMIRIFNALGPLDLKNIRRDSLLAWILVLPILLALGFRFAVPPLTSWLNERFAFDLTPYYPLRPPVWLAWSPDSCCLTNVMTEP
jgi:fluoroquinolone transport system permease protein